MESTTVKPAPYLSDIHWRTERPRSLVVCCSDGRLQKSIDDFLHNRMGVDDYDRLYAPGGPAVLADSGSEYVRANMYRRDLEFLFKAHRIEQILLIFHGAADDGPKDGGCAHYVRMMPGATHADMYRRQAADAAEVLRYIASVAPGLEVQVYRAEVQADLRVKFLNLAETIRP
jgi:hypothetical protein